MPSENHYYLPGHFASCMLMCGFTLAEHVTFCFPSPYGTKPLGKVNVFPAGHKDSSLSFSLPFLHI